MTGEFKILRDKYDEIAEQLRDATKNGDVEHVNSCVSVLEKFEYRFDSFGLTHWEEFLANRGE